MSQNDNQPREKDTLFGFYKEVFIGGGVTGCVILLIIAVALVIGFWLDAKFESGNHIFIFGSILLSVPVTFLAILWVVRWLNARKKEETAWQKQNQQEDADRGTSSEEA